MSKLDIVKEHIKHNDIVSIQINLLNACTSRCVYCRKYTWPKDILDFDQLKRTIIELREQGLRTIVFSGGDPLLYPHIIELLSFCEDIGVKTSLITTLITVNENIINALCQYPTRIHVSVDSDMPRQYEELRGTDKFELVERNLLEINTRRIANKLQPIRISCTLSNKNYDRVFGMYELAKRTKSTLNYYFVHRHDEFYPNDEENAEICRQLYAIEGDDITNARAILSGDFSNKQTCKSENCRIPWIHCLINANGDVYPCCKLLNDNGDYCEQLKYAYGNIYRDNLVELFRRRFYTTYNICEYCNGCEERYLGLIDEVNEIMDAEEGTCFL